MTKFPWPCRKNGMTAWWTWAGRKQKRMRYYFTSEDITSMAELYEVNHRTGILVWNNHLFSKVSQRKKRANVVLCFKNTYKCYKIEKQIFQMCLLNFLGSGCKPKKEKSRYAKLNQKVRSTSLSFWQKVVVSVNEKLESHLKEIWRDFKYLGTTC